MTEPAAIHAGGGDMAEDKRGDVSIPFTTDPIARMIWDDVRKAQEAGTLSYEVVLLALNRALITHLSQRAREVKAPH